MKDFLLLMLLVSSLLLSSLTLFQVSARTRQEIIRVPADYPTIQEAINAAASGSMILVGSGTYHEHLVVNKTLTLIGQDKATTIIDGNKTGTVVHIKANNVTINGFTLRNGGEGLRLEQFDSSIISSNIVTLNGDRGILLNKSSDNLIDDNLILRNGNPLPGISSGEGIRLDLSNNNTIINNIVNWNVVCGIALMSSCSNLIVNNTIEKSAEGIAIFNGGSKNNAIYHNNFIWNNFHVEGDVLPLNFWDDGTAGNYWDDYTGLDDGSNGRITGDGVGDTDLPHLGVDNYPLINPWEPIPVIWENKEYPVTLLSNSTISEFRFIQTDKKITFNVRGPVTTVGFCNATISKNLLRGNPWRVLLNTTDITSEVIITENQTHTLIHFTYNHSAFSVQIIGTWVIPEFPSTIILPLFIVFSIFAITFAKRKSCKKIKT